MSTPFFTGIEGRVRFGGADSTDPLACGHAPQATRTGRDPVKRIRPFEHLVDSHYEETRW